MSNASVKKFQAVMDALPDQIKAPIRREIFSQADSLRLAMSFAVKTGATGALRASIRVEPSKFQDMRALVRAGGPKTTHEVGTQSGFLTSFVRALRGRSDYDYAIAQEFGTRREPARPFFWPTYRAEKQKLRRKIREAAKEAISHIVPLHDV